MIFIKHFFVFLIFYLTQKHLKSLLTNRYIIKKIKTIRIKKKSKLNDRILTLRKKTVDHATTAVKDIIKITPAYIALYSYIPDIFEKLIRSK